ncbi:hypothetical protein Y032_0014g2268 [Ancylostoma ceylanicum]|uniref:Uncharacterized protein n=1 Tax=Ancylostoma ceylanicum TaxID=53326 RepID=A0A016V8N6_9BILA|nr:hypothetical protein Y032_0014g2268 [Ancylostoma ceylanicum]
MSMVLSIPMTTEFGVDMPVSSDLIERMHYKRRSSFIQEQRAKQTLEPLEEVEVDVVDGNPTKRPPRRKAASVCVAMVAMNPETSTSYELAQAYAQRKFGATSRFTVERNCQPLSLQEFQNVRLRGLSTSEVFHEPPKMYVYRERPVTYREFNAELFFVRTSNSNRFGSSLSETQKADVCAGIHQEAEAYVVCMGVRY